MKQLFLLCVLLLAFAGPALADPELSQADLEGLNVYQRRISTDTGTPGDKDHFLAIVTVYNGTRFHVTAMTLQMSLYREDGRPISFPYSVDVDLDPLDTSEVRAGPMPFPADAGGPVTGYFMTLVSAQGTRVPVSPKLPALTQLQTAASTGDMELLRTVAKAHPHLVRAGADADDGTLLEDAVAGHHAAAVAFLLGRGAPVNGRGKNGRTALMFAISYEDPALVGLLLAHKADVTLKDPKGRAALQQAQDRANSDGAGEPSRRIVDMLKAAH